MSIRFSRVYRARTSSDPGGSSSNPLDGSRKTVSKRKQPLDVRVGIEIETCIPQDSKLTLEHFKPTKDPSIRCRGDTNPNEFVLQSPMTYELNSSIREQHPIVFQDLQALYREAHACAFKEYSTSSSCSIHVHMSIPIRVSDDPLFLIVLQKLWMDRWEWYKTIFTIQTKDTYANANETVFSRRDLDDTDTKYYALNLRPTFLGKLAILLIPTKR